MNRGTFLQFQQEINWFYHTQLTLGARYDDNSIYGHSFNPRLGLVSQLDEHYTIKALYGSAYRAPAVFELYSSSPVRIPNPELRPETIDTYELSLHHKSNNALTKAVIFYNHLRDVILEGNVVDDQRTQIQNGGESKIYGLELDYRYHLNESLQLAANYSYQRGTNYVQAGNSDIHNVPEHKIKVGLDYQVSHHTHVHWMLHWIDAIDTLDTNPIDEIKSYWLSNLALTQSELFYPNLSVSIRVNNLFDSEYVHPGHRAANGANYSPVNEQPGRNFSLQATWQF